MTGKILIISFFIAATIKGFGAQTVGSVTIGFSKEEIGICNIIIETHVINTGSEVLSVPTRGYTYSITPDKKTGKTNIIATIDMNKSIIGHKIPPSEQDLRIIRLQKDESAIIRMDFNLNEDELTEIYEITINLGEYMANRYNYNAAVYHCTAKLPKRAGQPKTAM